MKTNITISKKLEEFDKVVVNNIWDTDEDGNYYVRTDVIKAFIRQSIEQCLEASRLEEKITKDEGFDFAENEYNEFREDQSQLINDIKK